MKKENKSSKPVREGSVNENAKSRGGNQKEESMDERKKKESWGEVADLEEERRKKDDSKVKRS